MSCISVRVRGLCRDVFYYSKLGSCAIAAAVLMGSSALATDVVRVEEDWEAVLDTPSNAKNAPQFETVMSPFGDIDSFFARATWNYRELPTSSEGGLQLQAWNGDNFLFKENFGGNKFSTVSETISWTQVLKTDGTLLTFRIKNGQSVTFGSFGGSNMKIEGNANLPNINGYDTAVSVDNGGLTYGGNRAILLRITEIRRYGAGNVLLSTDSTPRVLHQR